MSASTAIASINAILDPFLFQIIGSTPSGIRDNIKKTSIKGDAVAGVQLASACVFAAAVNKATLEGFISQPNILQARTTISSAFSISGKTNMTAMTLLGHCLLTTSFLDSVVFVKEFRLKMGQHDLWAGDFATGSLSDTQKKIYIEKKRVTVVDQAKVLGSGFFKYIGADKNNWTTDERDFWEDSNDNMTAANPTSTNAAAAPVTPPRPRQPAQNPTYGQSSPAPPSRPTQPRQPQQPSQSYQQAQYSPPRTQTSALGNLVNNEFREVTLTDGTLVLANSRAVDTYLSIESNSETSLVASIARNGIDSWNARYGAYAEGGIRAAATVAGSSGGA